MLHEFQHAFPTGCAKRSLVISVSVRGVPGYTEHAQYRDLYIYFDHADKISPVNELASKAFRMYGLRGAARIDWALIRGPAIVVRAEVCHSLRC